jgi:hypothetical protein
LAVSPLFLIGHWPSRNRIPVSIRKPDDHTEQAPAGIGLAENVVDGVFALGLGTLHQSLPKKPHDSQGKKRE